MEVEIEVEATSRSSRSSSQNIRSSKQVSKVEAVIGILQFSLRKPKKNRRNPGILQYKSAATDRPIDDCLPSPLFPMAEVGEPQPAGEVVVVLWWSDLLLWKGIEILILCMVCNFVYITMCFYCVR